jgi:hypothetical protein
MGMSDDFELAIEEGATIVRVGRALFGERRVAHGPDDDPAPEPAGPAAGPARFAAGPVGPAAEPDHPAE